MLRKNTPEHLRSLYRILILSCGTIYIGWWGMVRLLLPGSFNPLPSRLAVAVFSFAVYTASRVFPCVERHIMGWFMACASLVTLHYFYLFHRNQADVLNWAIGSYITVIAVAAGLMATRLLLSYSIGVVILSSVLAFSSPALSRTVFLPGMITIVGFAFLALNSRIRIMERERDAAARIQSLFDAVFEGIVVLDDGVIVDVNEAFLRIFGYLRKDVIGRAAADFIIPGLREGTRRRIDTMSEVPYESTGLRRDGSSVPIEITAKSHLFQGKALRLSAVRDLTERKRSEQDRIRYEGAREALKVREDFISIASHELKTPLTSIRMQVEMAESLVSAGNPEAYNPERIKKFISQMDRNSNRLISLVEEMLDVSRISSVGLPMKSEAFDLRELVMDTVGSYREAQGGGTPIELPTGHDPLPIRADRYRLEQVILNLLSNATKYGSGKPVRVEVWSEKQGNRALFAVEDQGIGIAEENQARIFQKFERAISARNVSGLGLGLYITRAIVEAHGGEISVKSRLSEGSRFTVSLPRAGGDPQ